MDDGGEKYDPIPDRFKLVSWIMRQSDNPAQMGLAWERLREVPEMPPTSIAVPQTMTLPVDINKILKDLQVGFVLRAIEAAHGNKQEAARLLNLKYTTFREMIYRLEREGLYVSGVRRNRRSRTNL